MFGKNFSQMLFVPPRFAKNLSTLVGKNIHLEVSRAGRWKVALCTVRGSLAFQNGWHKFVLANGIELGDILVFHYMRGSQFVVQIYGRSGCEKLSSSGEMSYPNKRTKISRDIIARNNSSESLFDRDVPQEDGLHVSVFSGSDADHRRQSCANKLNKLKVIEGNVSSQENISESKKMSSPSIEFWEDPCFMAKGETSFVREDDRDYLFDLSIFEMPENKVVFSETNELQSLIDESLQLSAVLQEAETEAVPIVKKNFIGEENTFSTFMDIEEETPLPANSPSTVVPLSSNVLHTSVKRSDDSEFAAASGTKIVKHEAKPIGQYIYGGAMAKASPLQEQFDFDLQQEAVRIPLNSEKCAASDGGNRQVKEEPKHLSQGISGSASVDTSFAVPTKEPLSSYLLQNSLGTPLHSEFAASGGIKLVKRELCQVSGDFCGNMVPGISLAAFLQESSRFDVLQKPIELPHISEILTASGGKKRMVKQEKTEFNQKDFPCAMAFSHDICSKNANLSVRDEIKINNGDPSEDLNHMEKDCGDADVIVKSEPLDLLCDLPSAPVIKASVLPESDCFLELPDSLPVLKTYKRGSRIQTKLVFLRDPARRIWPVVFLQRHGIKVLASGWKAFREANSIDPGAVCSFVIENTDTSIFSVQISRT